MVIVSGVNPAWSAPRASNRTATALCILSCGCLLNLQALEANRTSFLGRQFACLQQKRSGWGWLSVGSQDSGACVSILHLLVKLFHVSSPTPQESSHSPRSSCKYLHSSAHVPFGQSPAFPNVWGFLCVCVLNPNLTLSVLESLLSNFCLELL